MIGHEEHLRTLDAALGDGDLGITTRTGFAPIKAALPSLGDLDIGTALARCGSLFSSANPSTMAALLGIAFLRAGKVAKDKQALTLADLAAMTEAAADGIIQRGKAQPGDKTILDALLPAAEALRLAAARGDNLISAYDAAAAAAEAGVQATIPLRSKLSRASWLGERSLGQPDPGATLCALLFRAASTRLRALHSA
jgi:dihydroxyacetone kinase